MSRGTATTTMSRRSTTRGADEGDGGRSSGNRAARRAGRRRDAPSPRASPSRRASPSSPTTTNGRIGTGGGGWTGRGRPRVVRPSAPLPGSLARARRAIARPRDAASASLPRRRARFLPRRSSRGAGVVARRNGGGSAKTGSLARRSGRAWRGGRSHHADRPCTLFRRNVSAANRRRYFNRDISALHRKTAVRPRRDPTVRAHVNRTAR